MIASVCEIAVPFVPVTRMRSRYDPRWLNWVPTPTRPLAATFADCSGIHVLPWRNSTMARDPAKERGTVPVIRKRSRVRTVAGALAVKVVVAAWAAGATGVGGTACALAGTETRAAAVRARAAAYAGIVRRGRDIVGMLSFQGEARETRTGHLMLPSRARSTTGDCGIPDPDGQAGRLGS